MSRLGAPKNYECPRCSKMATHLVPTYWPSKFGKLCPACCQKANKQYDKNGWPPLPDGEGDDTVSGPTTTKEDE